MLQVKHWTGSQRFIFIQPDFYLVCRLISNLIVSSMCFKNKYFYVLTMKIIQMPLR